MEVPQGRIRVERSWLVLENPIAPTIRLDARFLDRVFADDDRLIVAVGEVMPIISIDHEPSVARKVAEQLASYTRSAQISRREVYDDAKRRLELASRGRRDNGAFALYFGNEDVYVDGKILSVGKFECWISDVELYAEAGANLPLPNGELPAELAMLVIAANRRVEDLDLLARRVAEYEATCTNESKKGLGG